MKNVFAVITLCCLLMFVSVICIAQQVPQGNNPAPSNSSGAVHELWTDGHFSGFSIDYFANGLVTVSNESKSSWYKDPTPTGSYLLRKAWGEADVSYHQGQGWPPDNIRVIARLEQNTSAGPIENIDDDFWVPVTDYKIVAVGEHPGVELEATTDELLTETCDSHTRIFYRLQCYGPMFTQPPGNVGPPVMGWYTVSWKTSTTHRANISCGNGGGGNGGGGNGGGGGGGGSGN